MPTLLSLHDHVIDLILSYLNQKCKMAVMLMNKEIYELAVKSLYKRIYVNDARNSFIDTYVCNDFNCEYTIVNGYEKIQQLFKQRQELLRFINLIMFRNGIDLVRFRKMKSQTQYGWIRDGLRIWKFRNLNNVDIIDPVISSRSVIPLEDTISLLVFLPEFNQLITFALNHEFVSYSKALEYNYLILVRDDNLKILASKLERVMNIQQLSLFFFDINIELRRLTNIINLNYLTSLVLMFIPGRTYELPPVCSFQWLFENIPNLKCLNIDAKSPHLISSIISLVQENSLQNLAVTSLHHSKMKASLMKMILNKQEKSIQRFACQSNFIKLCMIYKCGKKELKKCRNYEKLIAKFLGNNTGKYPHLNYIVMGNLHYEVIRSETGFHVNPVNYKKRIKNRSILRFISK